MLLLGCSIILGKQRVVACSIPSTLVTVTDVSMAVCELLSGMASTKLQWFLRRCQCSQGSIKVTVRYFLILFHCLYFSPINVRLVGSEAM